MTVSVRTPSICKGLPDFFGKIQKFLEIILCQLLFIILIWFETLSELLVEGHLHVL